MLINLSNLNKSYSMGTFQVQALKGINLVINEGDFLSVAGPSGSGKTTLMNIIGLIDKFDEGSLIIDGVEISNKNQNELTPLRQKYIGFIFQSFNLLPVLNVFENVEIPLLISKIKYTKSERQDRVNYLLEEVGLSDRRNHKPAELSGGQQQRVAIARALVSKPRIVIADEPTANLDSETGEKILNLMLKINKEENTTFIFSTHDPDIWEKANRVIFLQDGMIKQEKMKTT